MISIASFYLLILDENPFQLDVLFSNITVQRCTYLDESFARLAKQDLESIAEKDIEHTPECIVSTIHSVTGLQETD